MRWLGPGLFALALALSWAGCLRGILLSDRPTYLLSARISQGRVRRVRVAVMALLTVGFLALVAAFTLGEAPLLSATAILAVLLLGRRAENAQWPDNIVVRLGKYVPTAACLGGYLVAGLLLRLSSVGADRASSLSWNAACGIMAGIYVLAGIAKLRESGPGWSRPEHQALLIAERAFSGPRVLRSLRLHIAGSRAASRVVGSVGLWLELGAILFVVPVLRPFIAAAVVTLHIGFALVLGYVELEWVALIVAITLMAG